MESIISSNKGVTLLEVLIAVVLVAGLTAVGMGGYSNFRKKAKKAVCVSKMRALHSGFTSAVSDNGEWPQLPVVEDGPAMTESDYFGFWFKALHPYGFGPDSWLCPSDTRLRYRTQGDTKENMGSYIPTQFSPGAQTPFRWNQPWLVERAGYHGEGQHVLMPDGSVSSSINPFIGR